VLRADDSRLAANRAVRKAGATTELDRAVYSPCPICVASPTPLWQIKARTVVQDQAARTVTYRGAVLEMFGVPVAYAPWFRHPDPGVERQSGFLTPGFGVSSDLGLFAEVPYYYALAPNRDLTFAPLLTQQDGPVLAGEYRELRASGSTEVDGSLAYAAAHDDKPGREVRGHIRGEGRYPVTARTEAGWDAFLTTDDDLPERYRVSNDSVLENRRSSSGWPGATSRS
jgi:LPS-assembly protein